MAKATRRVRRPQFARVIFYNADLGTVSPVVSDYWERPVVELASPEPRAERSAALGGRHPATAA